MKSFSLVAAAGLLALTISAPAQAKTIQTECQAIFNTADENNDGTLAHGENNPFARSSGSASILAQELTSTVSEDEFMAECGAHVLQKMPANQLAMMFLLVSASAGAINVLSPD